MDSWRMRAASWRDRQSGLFSKIKPYDKIGIPRKIISHLHPKGQVKMGELFALAASCGIQVVIETHSNHILNGIRLAVHGGKLEPENVQLHYFQRQERNKQLVTEVISPRIDRNGRIDE